MTLQQCKYEREGVDWIFFFIIIIQDDCVRIDLLLHIYTVMHQHFQIPI